MAKIKIGLTVTLDRTEGPACSNEEIAEALRDFLEGETVEVQAEGAEDVSLYDVDTVS